MTKKRALKKEYKSWKETKLVRLNISLIEYLKSHAKYGESVGDVVGRLLSFNYREDKR